MSALLNELFEDLVKDSFLAKGGFQLEPPVLRLHRLDPAGNLPAVIRADSWSFTIPMSDKSKIPVALSWEFVRE